MKEFGLNVTFSLSEISISFLISIGVGKGFVTVINLIVVSRMTADISIFSYASGG